MKVIGGILLVLAFLCIVGTAGASECGNIETDQFILQCGVGFVLGLCGLSIGKITD